MGNVLCSDDGLVVYVIDQLRQLKLPGNIQSAEKGTLGHVILSYIRECENMAIIETIGKREGPDTVHHQVVRPHNINFGSKASRHGLTLHT